jgi:hypothetical protein
MRVKLYIYTAQVKAKKVKLFLKQAVEIYRFVKCQGSHSVESWLRDGGKFISLTSRTRFNTKKEYSSASGIHFCYRLGKSQSLMRLN